MKALPAIQAVEKIIKSIKTKKTPSLSIKHSTFKIILLSPAKKVFTQKQAHALSESEHIIFVCTRYEGIDYRFEQYMKKRYPNNFEKISIGQFVTLGGEVPAMVMIEAITRLIPGVIKEESSRQDESYNIKENMNNLEYPQYTHPEVVMGMKVPGVLLSGHHKKIEKWRNSKSKHIKPIKRMKK
jgi:tRNA (guanine37-N1)-methyltransferase